MINISIIWVFASFLFGVLFGISLCIAVHRAIWKDQ